MTADQINAAVNVAEPLVLEAIAFFRRKQAEGVSVTDADVINHVRTEAANILKEGADALTEFPDNGAAAGGGAGGVGTSGSGAAGGGGAGGQ
jgi:hypothetical protein